MFDTKVLRLALPIIIANASTPLVGLVDTAMLGFSSNPYYLAALAIGTTVISAVGWLFGYLKMALTGLVAQARGRNDKTAINTVFHRSLRTALITSLLLISAIPLIDVASIALLGSTDEVNQFAIQYINIRMIATPAIMVNLVIAGLLFGLAQPNKILIIYAVLNCSNVALDLLFVRGFGMTIDGVAYASVLAEYIALASGLYVIKSDIKIDWVRLITRFKTKGTSSLSSMYLDLFIRTLILQGILIFFMRYSASLGPNTLAVNGILFQLAIFTFYVLDGVAHSAEMLTGASYGKRNLTQFNYYCNQCFLWGTVLALLMSLVLLLGRDTIFSLLTHHEGLLESLRKYYVWLAILPITSFACFIYDGVYIGTSKTRIMRNMMGVTLLIFAFLVPILVRLWGNDGLWLCYHISMITRAISLAYFMPTVRSQLVAL